MMRRFRWLLLAAELVMLVMVSVVPPVDLPRTAFNETDTPINQATVPVVLSCRLALSGLHMAAVAVTVPIRSQSAPFAVVTGFHRTSSPRSSSLLALLCSFLC